MMSLVSSVYRLDLDVQQYLESVITHRLRGTCRLEELQPDKWKAARVCLEEERRNKAQSSAEQAARRRATRKLLNKR